MSIVHNCEYSFFLFSSFFSGSNRESFPLFFLAWCPFSINYPNRQQSQRISCFYICINSIIIILSILSHMYLYFVIEIILMSFFFFSLSFFLLFGTISLIYVFLSSFFSLFYFIIVVWWGVGANLTYAYRDRYAHTYTYRQLKLHLVRVWLHSM